ncbi:MAG: hypothetical protein HYY16_04220 [Planctomycetes bacterium]|nr:hypothetical protein [Planctomycetota bacterium]
MIITTPSLSIKKVDVFAALFKAQLPDTLSVIRAALKEWNAVHVAVDSVGALRRGTATKEQIRGELLKELAPDAALLDPIYRIATPEIPPGTLATFVPDAVRPRLAPEYQGWTYVPYREGRARVRKICEAALGREPQGPIGIADALAGSFNGSAVMDESVGTLATPTFRRTLEGLLKADEPVTFWDTAFAFEAKGADMLAQADYVLHGPDRTYDQLYFDSANASWFLVLHPGHGRMRLGLLA